MCNKAVLLNELIIDKCLDILCLTETWLSGGASDEVVLAELLPPGYRIIQAHRKSGRGGGVAIIYRESVKINTEKIREYSTFEHIQAKTTVGSCTYRIIVIYRPPRSQDESVTVSSFITELSKLIEEVVILNGRILITGDFNFHVDNKNDAQAQRFLRLLEACNLMQHLKVPTHQLGHTLDLAITRESDNVISNIIVTDQLISDHKLIMFNLPIARPTGFVAKTQDPSSLAPRFEGFTVPALTNARKNRNGRLLCPVRAVKVYLDRTAPHRPRCERLFVTAGRSKKEISKTTVSFWLRKTISRAYELSGTALPVPAPRARETRGIAPSILFRKNFAVDQC